MGGGLESPLPEGRVREGEYRRGPLLGSCLKQEKAARSAAFSMHYASKILVCPYTLSVRGLHR